jgi:hypothetical protein
VAECRHENRLCEGRQDCNSAECHGWLVQQNEQLAHGDETAVLPETSIKPYDVRTLKGFCVKFLDARLREHDEIRSLKIM